MNRQTLTRITNLILCVLTATFALPGGYLYVLPLQKAALILMIVSSAALLAAARSDQTGGSSGRSFRAFFRDNLIEITAVAAAVIWLIGGISKWHGMALTCFRLLILPFAVFWLIRQLNERDLIETSLFKRVFFVSMVVKMTARLVVEILYLLVLSREQIYWLYQHIFQTEIMFMGDQFPYARIQCPTDLIALLLIPVFFFSHRLAKGAKVTLFVLYTAFGLIVASRVYWLYMLVIAILCLIIYRKKISAREWAVISLLVAVFLLLFGGPLVEAVRFRFASRLVASADSARVIQARALFADIGKSPLIGHGLGATVTSYNALRGGTMVYELEYLWLFDQLGLIGFVLIVGGIYATYTRRTIAVIQPCGLNKQSLAKIRPAAAVLLLAMLEMLLHPLINPAVMGAKNGFFWIACYLLASDRS